MYLLQFSEKIWWMYNVTYNSFDGICLITDIAKFCVHIRIYMHRYHMFRTLTLS